MIYREDKGSELTYEEGDSNFRELFNNKVYSSSMPTVDDDETKEFKVGSWWVHSSGTILTCEDASTGAAVWTVKGFDPTIATGNDNGIILGVGNNISRLQSNSLNLVEYSYGVVLTEDGELQQNGCLIETNVEYIKRGQEGVFFLKNGSIYNKGGFDGFDVSVPARLFIDNKSIAKFSLVTYRGLTMLTDDNELWVFGKNLSGLGNGDSIALTYEQLDTNVKDLCISYKLPFKASSGYIKNDDHLYVFGENSKGQLGLGNTNDQYTKQDTGLLASKVWMDEERTFVLTTDNKLYASGTGTLGQLGLNGTSDVNTFTEVTTKPTTVVDIAIFEKFTMLLGGDGYIYISGEPFDNAWISHTFSVYDNIGEVSKLFNSFVSEELPRYEKNGRLYEFNSVGDSVLIDSFLVSENCTSTKSQIDTGSVVTGNYFSKFGPPVEANFFGKNILMAATTENTMYSPTTAGGKTFTGENLGVPSAKHEDSIVTSGKALAIRNGSFFDVIRLDASFYASNGNLVLVVTYTGDLYAYGSDPSILATTGFIASDVTAVEVGKFMAMYIVSKRIWTTGSNAFGQLGLGDTTNRTSFQDTGFDMDDNSYNTTTQIRLFENFTVVLQSSKLYVAGENSDGELGLGDNNDRNVFVKNVPAHAPSNLALVDLEKYYDPIGIVYNTSSGDIYATGNAPKRFNGDNASNTFVLAPFKGKILTAYYGPDTNYTDSYLYTVIEKYQTIKMRVYATSCYIESLVEHPKYTSTNHAIINGFKYYYDSVGNDTSRPNKYILPNGATYYDYDYESFAILYNNAWVDAFGEEII